LDEDALARGKVEGEMCKAVRNEAELELMVPRVKAPKDKLTVAVRLTATFRSSLTILGSRCSVFQRTAARTIVASWRAAASRDSSPAT